MAFTAFKLEKHLCEVIVLDGTEIQSEVANLTYGIHLLEYVCEKLGITESCYFGLKYKHHKDGKNTWLQTHKFIGQQVHSKVYEFELHIKYWPSTPYVVEQDITRYQMVLAMRAKLLNGELACSIPIQALLASYLLQAELGNYKDIEEDGGYHSFISNETLQFFPNQPKDFLEKVKEFHVKHHEVAPAAAELLYLENARKILMYGMDIHDVLTFIKTDCTHRIECKTNYIYSDADGISVILGVNHEGVHIIQNNIVLNKMYWANVLNLKPKKNKRIVFLKLKGMKKDDYDTMKLGFISPTTTDWKRLHRSCKDQMGFFNASKPSDDKTDGKGGKQEKKKDPTIRYSHCAGDHYKVSQPFVRVNTIKFVEKKKQERELAKGHNVESKEEIKNSSIYSDENVSLPVVDETQEKTTIPAVVSSSATSDDKVISEEGIEEKREKEVAKEEQEHPEEKVQLEKPVEEKVSEATISESNQVENTPSDPSEARPVTPQVVTCATDEVSENSRQSMISNDQSFISECDSVIEHQLSLDEQQQVDDEDEEEDEETIHYSEITVEVPDIKRTASTSSSTENYNVVSVTTTVIEETSEDDDKVVIESFTETSYDVNDPALTIESTRDTDTPDSTSC